MKLSLIGKTTIMKKTMCMLAILLTAGAMTGKAQIQRGNVLVGGDLANINVGLSSGRQTSFTINPKAAWFVKDNTALGVYTNFYVQTQKGKGTQFNYGVGVFGRQYANGNSVPAVRHTRLFIEANVGFEGQNASASSTGVSTNGLGFGFGPGLAYFITPNIGLEGLVKYNGIAGFGNEPYTNNLNLQVGFQIYLPGRAVRTAVSRDVR